MPTQTEPAPAKPRTSLRRRIAWVTVAVVLVILGFAYIVGGMHR